MSAIKIEFSLDNATFASEDLGNSIADALDNLAGRIREANRKYLALPGQSFVVRDTNGNTVGKATFEDIGEGFEDIDEGFEDAEDYISGMSREYVVELLESCSILYLDEDGVGVLRESLLQCVKNGDLTLEDVKSHCGD